MERRQWFPQTYFLDEAADLAIKNIIARLDPALGYQPYFALDYGSDPPEARHASWDYCDMAGRYVDALILARQITGNQHGREAETALRDFFLARAHPDDGLFYDAEAPWSKYAADMFCQGRALLGLTSWFLLTGDQRLQATIEAMLAGLSRIAVHEDDYCYYPQDRWSNGEWVGGGLWQGKVPGYSVQQLIGIARYAEATGSPLALELAGKLARYFVYHSGVVAWDGSFQGHTHSGGILPSALGVLRYALVAGDTELAEWGRRVYEHARAHSSSFGWVPDGLDCDLQTNAFAGTCETCGLVDMLELALTLTDAGLGEYWDDIERYSRNQFLENQFRDPELVVSAERCAQSTTPVAAIVYGSFASTARPNNLLAGPHPTIEGCCVGAAARGCFLVWDRIISERSEGIFVNLAFSRDGAWGRLISSEPYRGELVLLPAQAQTFFVRIPAWAERSGLQVTLDGIAQPIEWHGSYLALGPVQPDQEWIITYPQAQRETSETIAEIPFSLRWKGGTVTAVAPAGGSYPIYQRESFEASEPPMTQRPYRWQPVTVRW